MQKMQRKKKGAALLQNKIIHYMQDHYIFLYF